MKQMWAPWRLEYIVSDKDDGCFLCESVADTDDRETLLVKRGAVCGVILNRYPYNNGHLLVFPYRHVGTIGGLTSEERLETMDLVVDCVAALARVMNPHGYNVGLNQGRSAGAGLDEHIHTHIVPRWEGDTNFMPVFADVKIIPQSLLDLYDALSAELA